MKDNIKTAEDLYDMINGRSGKVWSKKEIAIMAMRVYAEQFIDLAAEEVITKTSKTMWQGMSDFVEVTEIDKQSILKIKELIK